MIIEEGMCYKCLACGFMFEGEAGSPYCPDCMSDDIDVPTDEEAEAFLNEMGL